MRDRERLAESAGSRRDPFVRDIAQQAAVCTHRLLATQGFYRPQQHSGALTLRLTHEIRAQVDPVDAVDVQAAGGTEHAPVSGSPATMSVRCRVLALTQVRLDFDDASGQGMAAPVAP